MHIALLLISCLAGEQHRHDLLHPRGAALVARANNGIACRRKKERKKERERERESVCVWIGACVDMCAWMNMWICMRRWICVRVDMRACGYVSMCVQDCIDGWWVRGCSCALMCDGLPPLLSSHSRLKTRNSQSRYPLSSHHAHPSTLTQKKQKKKTHS